MRMKLTVILERIALTLVLRFSRVVMQDLSENRCESTAEVCETPPAGVGSSSALAVVPYDEKTLTIPDFYRDERLLQFAEFSVTIGQNWRDVGVAAVVWDAVSSFAKPSNPGRVTTCVENLEMSGNLTAVREMSGILPKIREVSGEKSCHGKVA